MSKDGEQDEHRFIGFTIFGNQVTPNYSSTSENRVVKHIFLAYFLTIAFQLIVYHVSLRWDRTVWAYHHEYTDHYYIFEAPVILGNELFDYINYLKNPRNPCEWRRRFPGLGC
jgi:hypothetical protein